jgi:hypothetical protein
MIRVTFFIRVRRVRYPEAKEVPIDTFENRHLEGKWQPQAEVRLALEKAIVDCLQN